MTLMSYNEKQKALIKEWKEKAAALMKELAPLLDGTLNNTHDKALRDLQIEYAKKIKEAANEHS